MADERAQTVSLIYDGGIAAIGELHFYEFSRAVYGFSRLIQVLEYYRREGRVAQRITGEANVDIIIKAPQRGSFIVDAGVLASQIVPYLKEIPFSALFTYFIDLLKSKTTKSEDLVLSLAKIRLREEEQKTLQSTQETRRIEVLREIITDKEATNRQTIELLGWALKSSNTALGRSGMGSRQLNSALSEARADSERRAELEKNLAGLQHIPPDDLARLSRKVRPLIREVGLPLRKSAESVSFSVGDSHKRMANFSREEIRQIDSREIDSFSSEVLGTVKSYDKETGLGKLRERATGSVYSFVIPFELRGQMLQDIASAMRAARVLFRGRAIRDKGGAITSYLISALHAQSH